MSTTVLATSGRRRPRQRRRKRRRSQGWSAGSMQIAPASTSIASKALLGLDMLPSGSGISQPDGIAATTNVTIDDNGLLARTAQAPPCSIRGAPTLCHHELDPLVEAICADDGPPALVVSFDLMLEKLLACVFVVNDSVETVAPMGFAELPLVAASSLPPSSTQELAQLTPPRVGQLDVDIGDKTPTSSEAVQRLTQFLDEVQVVREPPLIASPPRQSTRTRRPLPIRHRSRRITAQPLAHIPASKRGEVLLMQRLRIAPWTALVSPVPK